MRICHAFLAASISLLAFTTPAVAAVNITVGFTEPATDGLIDPFPSISGWNDWIVLQSVERTTVTLNNYFAAGTSFSSFFFNLLEPGNPNQVSDQITFSRPQGSNALVIDFVSDPAEFVAGDAIGSVGETGTAQTLTGLTDRLPGLTVTASSDVDAVPEPATWALMLIGFGGVGVAMRRRKKLGLPQIA